MYSGRGDFLARAADAGISDQIAPTAGFDDPVHDLPISPVMSASGNPGTDHCRVEGLHIAHDEAYLRSFKS